MIVIVYHVSRPSQLGVEGSDAMPAQPEPQLPTAGVMMQIPREIMENVAGVLGMVDEVRQGMDEVRLRMDEIEEQLQTIEKAIKPVQPYLDALHITPRRP